MREVRRTDGVDRLVLREKETNVQKEGVECERVVKTRKKKLKVGAGQRRQKGRDFSRGLQDKIDPGVENVR